MSKYTINFIYNDGNLTFEVKTNYEFEAINKLESEEKSKEIESVLEKCLTVFYDKESKTIKSIIEKNSYFSEISLNNYMYYGEILSKEEFNKLIERDYGKHLKSHSILIFKAISYGIDIVDER